MRTLIMFFGIVVVVSLVDASFLVKGPWHYIGLLGYALIGYFIGRAFDNYK